MYGFVLQKSVAYTELVRNFFKYLVERYGFFSSEVAGKGQISLNTSIIFFDSFVRERNGYGDVIESAQIGTGAGSFRKTKHGNGTGTGRI